MMRSLRALAAVTILLVAAGVAAETPVQTRVAERFQLTLLYNMGTGYQWQPLDQPDAKLLKLIGTEYRSPANNQPGAEGEQVWTFEALAPGKTKLTFSYVRPWEKSAPPARTTNFTVVIDAAAKPKK